MVVAAFFPTIKQQTETIIIIVIIITTTTTTTKENLPEMNHIMTKQPSRDRFLQGS